MAGWRPYVLVEDEWNTNSCVFETEEEAQKYAHDLFNRWWLCKGHEARFDENADVNYVWDDTVGACRLPDEEEEILE